MLETGRPPEEALPRTDEFVELTVWMSFFIGVLFTATGFKARQRWLVFWGALTLLACAVYWISALS